MEEEVLHTAVDEQGYEPRRSLMFLRDGGITPVNDYLPPVNEEGYCVLEIPQSLLDNKTPEEVLFENNYSAEAE